MKEKGRWKGREKQSGSNTHTLQQHNTISKSVSSLLRYWSCSTVQGRLEGPQHKKDP